MSISVELSVEPHHKVKPPHTIAKWELDTWNEVRDLIGKFGFTFHDNFGDIYKLVNQWKEDNEYVQVELEVMEVTGTKYTGACLSIEGEQHPAIPMNYERPPMVPTKSFQPDFTATRVVHRGGTKFGLYGYVGYNSERPLQSEIEVSLTDNFKFISENDS